MPSTTSTSSIDEAPYLNRWWTYLARTLLVALGIAAWFLTQSFIGARTAPAGTITDGLHELLAPANRWLWVHPRATNVLLAVSSACIDAMAVFVLARAIFGKSLRPFIGLVALFALRQACQALCALPVPQGMIWRSPGVPSLLVTYGVANDLFFSGHTAIAVFGATELARLGRWLGLLGAAIAVFEMVTVLALRAHYTMDVFTGVVTALLVAVAAARVAPACDRAWARVMAGTRVPV